MSEWTAVFSYPTPVSRRDLERTPIHSDPQTLTLRVGKGSVSLYDNSREDVRYISVISDEFYYYYYYFLFGGLVLLRPSPPSMVTSGCKKSTPRLQSGGDVCGSDSEHYEGQYVVRDLIITDTAAVCLSESQCSGSISLNVRIMSLNGNSDGP